MNGLAFVRRLSKFLEVDKNILSQLNKICAENKNVHIRDKDEVGKKIAALINGGKDSLQIISDFDMTLSRYSYNNKRCPSCHGVLETSSDLFPREIMDKLKALKDRFYPLETDPTLTIKEKIPLMIQWWEGNHKIMEESGISYDGIRNAVSTSGAMMRDGHEEFFKDLNDMDIPLLIFSAGLGDVLNEIIRQRSNFYPNMKVVANFMKFDEKGVMCGFQGNLIHTFNKNESALENSTYFERVASRKNVILLGDSMGDLRMADGLKDIDTCLRIGYLNAKVDEWLDEYKDKWDIVLVEDSTLGVAQTVLSSVLDTQM